MTNTDAILPQPMIESLKALAGLDETKIEYTSRGLKFTFENSLAANYCQIIEYHDNIIVEFRKKTDNIIEGKLNRLVSEEIIPRDSLQEYFESATGIYLSYLG